MLQRTRTETDLLEATDKLYGRYVTAVTQVEAAALSAANNDFDDQARLMREATASLQAAEAEQTDLKDRHRVTRTLISELEGRREAADTALRDHAGAELPHMETRAEELTREAAGAAERAGQATLDATTAAEQAEESADTAHESQQHLTSLTEDLRRDSAKLGGDGAFDQLLSAAQQVATARPDLAPVVEIDQLCATPLAWTDFRAQQVRKVGVTLRGHERAQQAEQSAARNRRDAEDEEDAHRSVAEAATGQRQEAEHSLVEAITSWAETVQYLKPVPQELITLEDQAGDDRLNPDRLTTWLNEVVTATQTRIDLAGREKTADTDAALAMAAANTASGEAEKARLTAARQAAAVAEARELYGAEYQELRTTRQEIGTALGEAKEQSEQLIEAQIAAGKRATAAQTTLNGIKPHREAAGWYARTRMRSGWWN